MHYPTLKTLPASRETVDAFRGLNRQEDIGPGEFAGMENFTADAYPLAQTCRSPGPVGLPYPQGLLAKQALCYVAREKLYVGEQAYDLGLSPGEKQLVSMGAYVLILPDRLYFNTADPQDFGPVEQVLTEPFWHMYPCDAAGNRRTFQYIGIAQPESPQEGEYWYDTSHTPHQLRRYNAVTNTWGYADSYISMTLDVQMNPRFPFTNFFPEKFHTGDVVDMQVLGDYPLCFDTQSPMPDCAESRAVKAMGGPVELRILGGNRVVVPGMLPKEVSIANSIRFGSPMPVMDHVFECSNRLWGCRYGDQNGKFVNEIYASRLGDFRGWSRFQGVSTDAYTASVGTDGPFTGAMNYLGYPLFFKENCLHRVYGSYPSEYRIQTTPCQGVAPGCGGSLCLLEDTALYLGRNGVCAYDGAMPSLISRELGTLSGPACAGALGHKYYLSTGEGLFVYDSQRRLWHRRSPIQARCLVAWNGKLLYPDVQTQTLMALEQREEAVDFFLTTGRIAANRFQRLRSLALRYGLKGWAMVEAEYDSQGHWHCLGYLKDTGLGWRHLPLRPRRCDHLRLRIRGRGQLKLHSLVKTLEKGSDLP